ncbi:MAG: Uma2 family endonuclease [Alphaproteobacteria bacterium HGW-Alphaproteobacteria-16]|nr:MAG: Uma2 family endonuclease [Alphaproteobacteria bacterium HGW-Alphaproteobacteria-16]
MTEAVPLTTEWKPVKLRVEDYLMLDDAGAFDSYGRTELIEGEIVYMNAQHRPHARIQSRLLVLLANELAKRSDGLEALVEGSVAMPPYNVPEPDIAITTEPEGNGLIPLASLALVVEVADTTLRNDLTRKAEIYSREGVPEYWVVDVNASVIHQMWAPETSGYSEHRTVPFGSDLAAATIADLIVDTANL